MVSPIMTLSVISIEKYVVRISANYHRTVIFNFFAMFAFMNSYIIENFDGIIMIICLNFCELVKEQCLSLRISLD